MQNKFVVVLQLVLTFCSFREWVNLEHALIDFGCT